LIFRERLDKALSRNGYGTRNDVKKLIRRGLVEVNSQVIKDAGFSVCPTDSIQLEGEKIEHKEHYFFLMNKPSGVITATHDPRDKTVIDLLSQRHQSIDLFPVGRLDKDTEGLLLLTTDGKLAHELLSPKKHVPKVYFVKVQGQLEKEDIGRFEIGITLEDGYTTKPAILEILQSGEVSEVNLTITEGKFHQVKRMFQALDKEVLYLQRIKFGSLVLDPSLELGSYRELTESELESL
jgi:16S rRNA pseudouridine516 synthase